MSILLGLVVCITIYNLVELCIPYVDKWVMLEDEHSIKADLKEAYSMLDDLRHDIALEAKEYQARISDLEDELEKSDLLIKALVEGSK